MLHTYTWRSTLSKLILNSSNAEYHKDKTHLSSSGLKTLLASAQQFHHEYVLGNKEQIERDVFTEGSLTHTLILEPHKINEYAVFPGLRRAGTAYTEFKAQNASKTVVSAAQMLRCQKLFTAYQSLPAALNILKGTLSEHSMVSEILRVPVKARADAINIDAGIIIDVKTTAMPSDVDIFKQTVLDYSYHLSAALYCQIAFNTYGKLFSFYWLVLSKADNRCHIYKASTETLSTGSALVTQAIVKYKKCRKHDMWLDSNFETDYSTNDYEILEV